MLPRAQPGRAKRAAHAPDDDHVAVDALARLAQEEVDVREAHPDARDADGHAAHAPRQRQERALRAEPERRGRRVEPRRERLRPRGRAHDDLRGAFGSAEGGGRRRRTMRFAISPGRVPRWYVRPSAVRGKSTQAARQHTRNSQA
jgi:hypothetical protein